MVALLLRIDLVLMRGRSVQSPVKLLMVATFPTWRVLLNRLGIGRPPVLMSLVKLLDLIYPGGCLYFILLGSVRSNDCLICRHTDAFMEGLLGDTSMRSSPSGVLTTSLV